MTVPTRAHESVYYPFDVHTVEQLAADMAKARWLHGRCGCCAWRLMWKPGRPIILWEEAERVVRAERKGRNA